MNEHSKTPWTQKREHGQLVAIVDAAGRDVFVAEFDNDYNSPVYKTKWIDDYEWMTEEMLAAVNSHAQLVEAAQIGLRAAKLLVKMAGDHQGFGPARELWEQHAATIENALCGTPEAPTRDQLVEACSAVREDIYSLLQDGLEDTDVVEETLNAFAGTLEAALDEDPNYRENLVARVAALEEALRGLDAAGMIPSLSALPNGTTEVGTATRVARKLLEGAPK